VSIMIVIDRYGTVTCAPFGALGESRAPSTVKAGHPTINHEKVTSKRQKCSYVYVRFAVLGAGPTEVAAA
jgi:hypothetical protein